MPGKRARPHGLSRYFSGGGSARQGPIALKCRLHKISREVLPELNDEVAGKAGFPDAEALRKAIADQAANNKIRTVRSAAQQKLLEGLLDSQDFLCLKAW